MASPLKAARLRIVPPEGKDLPRPADAAQEAAQRAAGSPANGVRFERFSHPREYVHCWSAADAAYAAAADAERGGAAPSSGRAQTAPDVAAATPSRPARLLIPGTRASLQPVSPGAAREEARRLLQESFAQIERLPHGPGEFDERTQAFNVLRRAMAKASGCQAATQNELLYDLEPKSEVLRFVVEYHRDRKAYRNQAIALLTALLRVDTWLWALLNDVVLYQNLPESLLAHVPQRLPTPPKSPASRSPPESPRSRAIRESAMMAWKQKSELQGLQRSNVSEDLRQCREKLEMLNYDVPDGHDGVAEAFEALSRAVKHALRSGDAGDAAALRDFEPKDRTLEFLTLLYERRRIVRSRVPHTLAKLLKAWHEAADEGLLNSEAWRAAEDMASPPRAATSPAVLGFTQPPGDTRSLQAAACAAVERGCLGILFVGKVVRHNLATNNLQVWIAVDGPTLQDDAVVAQWRGVPLLFDVASPHDQVEVLVVDSDTSRNSEPVGTLSLKIADVPVHFGLPASHFILDGASNSALEIGLVFVRGEDQAATKRALEEEVSRRAPWYLRILIPLLGAVGVLRKCRCLVPRELRECAEPLLERLGKET